MNKLASGFKATVIIYSSQQGLVRVSQECGFSPAPCLFFPASDTKKTAYRKSMCGFGERGSTYDLMLHPRKLPLCNIRILAEKMIGYDQSKHRVSDEFERLVVKSPRLFLMSRGNLLVCP